MGSSGFRSDGLSEGQNVWLESALSMNKDFSYCLWAVVMRRFFSFCCLIFSSAIQLKSVTTNSRYSEFSKSPGDYKVSIKLQIPAEYKDRPRFLFIWLIRSGFNLDIFSKVWFVNCSQSVFLKSPDYLQVAIFSNSIRLFQCFQFSEVQNVKKLCLIFQDFSWLFVSEMIF